MAAKGSLPIIGPRTVAQLEGNLAATEASLSPEQITRLDEASLLPPVFPYTLLDDPENRQRVFGGKFAQFDWPPEPVA